MSFSVVQCFFSLVVLPCHYIIILFCHDNCDLYVGEMIISRNSKEKQAMLRNELIQKGLSNRECEVAELLYKGLDKSEISDQLLITVRSVSFHLLNIKKKLFVRSIKALVVELNKLDLLSSSASESHSQDSDESFVLSDEGLEADEFSHHSGALPIDHVIGLWCDRAKQAVESSSRAEYPDCEANHRSLEFMEGPKRIRVVMTGSACRSAYCFIDKSNGDILKASSWSQPAKGARGNVTSVDPSRMTSSTHWLYR
jgi:DNA-binding CsgD family transcriptional regulator